MKELEREVRELKRANEILRKGSAFFGQPELDREPVRNFVFVSHTDSRKGRSKYGEEERNGIQR